jgi:hypothetical protein
VQMTAREWAEFDLQAAIEQALGAEPAAAADIDGVHAPSPSAAAGT